MFEKRFLYGCVAFLCMVMAFHFGANTASGQGGNTQFTVIGATFSAFAVTTTGDVYYHSDPDITGDNQHWNLVGNIPTASPIVNIREIGGNGINEYVWAYAADGSFFVSSDFGHSWAYKGNVVSGQTPVHFESWGALKARYRGRTK